MCVLVAYSRQSFQKIKLCRWYLLILGRRFSHFSQYNNFCGWKSTILLLFSMELISTLFKLPYFSLLGGGAEYLRGGGMGGINVFTVNLSGHFSILTPCPPLKWPTPKADVECRQAGMGLCFHFCLLSFNCCSSLCDLYMVLLFTVEVRQIKKLSGKKYFYRISFDPPTP